MSAVPAVIDALLAAVTAALPGVQVVDGKPTTDVAGDVIAVGFAPQEGSPAADCTERDRGLRVIEESVSVSCLARSWSGDGDVKAQRDRTYALLTAVRGRVRTDRTLGGVVRDARLTSSSYVPWRTTQGQLVVDVQFRVEASVLT